MEFTIRQRAPEHSRYTEESCKRNIGKTLPFRNLEDELVDGIVKDARILENGAVLEVTFEVVEEE